MNESDGDMSQRVGGSALSEDILRRRLAPISTVSGGQAPTSAMRSRIESLRQRTRQRPTHRSGASVQQAVDRLNEASSNISSLLEQPIPRIGSPDIIAREYSGEAEVNSRRRAKRRKIEPEAPSTGHMNGFSYGHRGQVVSGPLKMDILHCDGGVHAEACRHGSGREYARENVLRNDKSVYCTDSSKCNLILRHLGETPFSLKKLVIKAPERGFTAPIQEGMIFVAMDSTDLLHRTARYRLREASPASKPSEHEPYSEYSRILRPGYADPNTSYIISEHRPPSRRRDSHSTRAVPPPVSDSHPRGIYHANSATGTVSNASPLPISVDFSNAPSPPASVPEEPEFTVTTTCDPPSSDDEEPSSAATLADLYRRYHVPPHDDDDVTSDSEAESGLDRALRQARDLGIPNGSGPGRRRCTRRMTEPSRIELVVGDADAAHGVLKPHATFFIERERSVVSVKFDPPV
ncbi:hypothetical protein MMC21_003437 [Puttea exsequens]|nr:hypothetical protein [Puttea exsequens]